MSFETVENVLHIKADSVMTLAMAAVLLLLGYFVRNKVSFLGKYCIPAPVVGGFLFMFVTFAGHQTGALPLTSPTPSSPPSCWPSSPPWVWAPVLSC